MYDPKKDMYMITYNNGYVCESKLTGVQGFGSAPSEALKDLQNKLHERFVKAFKRMNRELK